MKFWIIYLNTKYTHTHTHTHIYIYIYVCVCVCVCVHVCIAWKYDQPHAIHLKVMTWKQMSNYPKD